VARTFCPLLIAAIALAACARLSNRHTASADFSDVHERTELAAGEGDGGSADASPDGFERPSGLPPLPAEPLFTNLSVAGFPDAVVSVPNGATSPRPVIIVLHGSGDRPDWNCDAWRHMTGAHGFVLCPRGDPDLRSSTPDDRRYTLRGGSYLRRYIEVSVEVLAARYAGYVQPEHPILTGFSLGATQAALLAVDDPSAFPRVALLEGGHGAWTTERIARFHGHGGERVLFGCGSAWCVPAAKSATSRLEKAGVESRAVYANVGHTNDRPLQEAIMTEIGWFLGGDSRWSSVAREHPP
jgi:predicted esterase